MFKHSVSVKWSDEDNGFIAFVPELEGLSAFGETREEAVKELTVAAEAYMETLRESGRQIPAPGRILPYSGQFRLRLPKWLHAKLAMEAEQEGISLNTYLVSLLANRQGERNTVNEFIKLALDAVKNAFEASYRVEGNMDSTRYIAKEREETAPPADLTLIVGGKI